jgi:heme O synthase-like polyprenyltransferase
MKTPSDLPELAAELAIETDSASRWRDFYELTKPRLNFLVIVTTHPVDAHASRDRRHDAHGRRFGDLQPVPRARI